MWPTDFNKGINNIQRAAALAVWCEQAEAEQAQGSDFDVASYTTAANTMRRLLADVGLERRAKDVTDLQTYIRQREARA